MWTLIGYTESQDSATLTGVAALADQHVRVSGDDITVPRALPTVIGSAALGTDITRAQLRSPSLRRVVNFEIMPIGRGAAEPGSPPAVVVFPNNPIPIVGDESLNAFAAEDGVGATRSTVLVMLADGPVAPVGGEIFTVRVTGATTLTANAWTNGALTFDQTLPVGRYQIVGARQESTGLQAFRFVFVGGLWRPGWLGTDAAADILTPGQRYGGWGAWGEFDQLTPPTVDWLSNSADAAETGEIDLVKIA